MTCVALPLGRLRNPTRSLAWGGIVLGLAAAFVASTLSDWLQLFDGEDVCVGPVATLAEGAKTFGAGAGPPSAPVGQHTDAWRHELGFS